MTKSQNPLRTISGSPFGVEHDSKQLLANGIYSVEDIIQPFMTNASTRADPRLFVSTSGTETRLRWRQVNRQGWISPRDTARDDKNTVLQVKFNRPKKLNFVSFELLRVPQVYSVHYYDIQRQRMVKLSDKTGRLVEGQLYGLKANVLHPGKEKNNSHKWRTFEYVLPKIRTNLIEIRLNREIHGINEVHDFFDLPNNTAYSLGIRNLKLKYKVHLDDDVDDDDDDGTPSPIGTTERPLVVRHSSLHAHDGNDESYWECGPQGSASSVVPFYVDMRATDGTASIFDTVKLQPLWTGPSMSMYWSNDDITTPWSVSPNRVSLTQGGDTNATFVEDHGLLVTASDSSWVDETGYMRADLSQDFVVGLQFTPTVTNSAADRWFWVFEKGASTLGLKFDPTAQAATTMTGQFKVVKNGSTVLYTSASYTLTKDATYGIVLGYNHSDRDTASPRGWHLSTSTANTAAAITSELGAGTAPTDFFADTFRIGSDEGQTKPVQGYITKLWARLDSFSDQVAQTYLLSPDPFINGDGDQEQRVNGLYNAILLGRLQKTPRVRIGPGAGFFRNKEWTPIPIDYTLSTGQYELPVTQAKFLKLEFSNLVPRVYLTTEETLPCTNFPATVTNWYRSIYTPKQGIYKPAFTKNLFESVSRRPPTPGDGRRIPQLRSTLENNGAAGGIPPVIFHKGQSTAEYAINPDNFDGSTKYRELEFATTPMRFFRTSRHDYETTFIPVEQTAYFVGIKELEVFRSDQSVMMDNPEYNDTFMDEFAIDINTDFINVGSSFQGQNDSAELVSVLYESFSKFETVQVAAQDCGWVSDFSPAQINLGTITHLTDPSGVAFASSTSTTSTVVTNQYLGARTGNSVEYNRVTDSIGSYGVRTESGLVSSVTGANPRTSAVVRMQLPKTNTGTYELRLYAFDGEITQQRRLVAVKPIKMPVKTWREIEVAYIANDSELDWQAEVIQTDAGVSEPFIVEMLGVWQNPIKWEFSNDDGDTYTTAMWPLNDPHAYLRFAEADNRLRVRVTALRDDAIAGGYTVVPWYLESSMVVRAPIDYNPPWGISDSQDLRDPTHKPVFQVWSHFFPQVFSVQLLGLPLPNSR